jgi:hypothetical protein
VADAGRFNFALACSMASAKSSVSARGAFGEMRNVLCVGCIEDKHRNGARFPVVAQELVHDVGILVAKKNTQVDSSGLGNAHCGGQLPVNIAAPGFGDHQQLSRTIGMLAGLLKEDPIFRREHRVVVVLLESIPIDGRSLARKSP